MNFRNLSIGQMKYALMAAILVFGFSCKREVLEEKYPAEVTMQNWEQFIDAPQDVIDALLAKEMLSTEASTQKAGFGFPTGDSPETVLGWIKGYNGAWNNLPGATVTTSGCGVTTTVGNTPSGYNYFLTCDTWKCITYSTSVVNGVSTFDLVLISRHIQNIQLFTTYRELCAADVNVDGSIDQTDIDLIRDVILGNTSSFPTDNVRFVPESFYNGADSDWVNYSFYAQYPLANCNNPLNYYGVKCGDVSGNFSF